MPDVERIREDFPILAEKVRNNAKLVYLDNAATTQKPYSVLGAVSNYYALKNANIHRAVHWLSQLATEDYEKAREAIRQFINAPKVDEVIFVRGTTEGINLVANSWGRAFLKPGDEVLITLMEHHSNIVPWQLVCKATSAKLVAVPMLENGELDWDAFKSLINEHTKVVAATHVSNALGTVNDVKRIASMAKKVGALCLIDGAQSVPYCSVDVQDIGCDFFVFSGHKVYGPTGVGVLWGREELLDAMMPWQGGGDMIRSVTIEETLYAPLPHKFEAGTPHIAGAIGLMAAIDYVRAIGIEAISAHERYLMEYTTKRLMDALPDTRIFGQAKHKAGVLSFAIRGIHPHDIGTILDQDGVAIRTGHHCAQPVMDFYGVPATARASFALYNTLEECDQLVKSLVRATKIFS